MRICIIESPFKGATPEQEAQHKRYLNLCIRDSVMRGETPYASHRMLTEALDDADPAERELGIAAGFDMRIALLEAGAVTVIYDDYGISDGMRRGIRHAENIGCRVETRTLWTPETRPVWAAR